MDIAEEYEKQINFPVFHYCSAAGFQGIIESKVIWMTHSDYLNDYMECRTLEKIFYGLRDNCHNILKVSKEQIDAVYEYYKSDKVHRFIA